MNLETAFEIIQHHINYLSQQPAYEWLIKKPIDVKNNKIGDEIPVPTEYAIDSYDLDKSKLYVFRELTIGGEDEGSHYEVIYKLDHPELGSGYISYTGNYDSWNGVDWDCGTVKVVEPKLKTITVFE